MSRPRKVHNLGPADIPVGGQKIITVGKREIGVFNINGHYHALPNLCPHSIGPLCTGNVSGTTYAGEDTGWEVTWVNDGEIVACPWHGIEYHIPTGRCLPFPEISIRSYPVWEEDGELKIEL